MGTDSGTCDVRTVDPLWRAAHIPFCANAVAYPACLPTIQTIQPSRNFPNGRWINHTYATKDAWISASVTEHIKYRIGKERNKTMKATNRNEYGDVGNTRRRFYMRPNCQLAFKNLFCWINFPRCDPETGVTMPTCRSACENFFQTCNYDHALWRCYKSKYFNDLVPEEPRPNAQGNLTYLREYFPGQPFRKNKYTTMGVEIPICTPAIRGAGAHGAGRGISAMLLSFGAAFLLAIALLQPFFLCGKSYGQRN